MNNLRRIHVIAAVIRDPQGRILIAKRPEHVHQGGLWEFPGGKLEPGEPRLDGLRRELQEELGITVTAARPLLDIRHDYPDKSIRLDVWLVNDFTGQAHGAEGQPVRWISPAQLDDYPFPAANAPIVRAAQLPDSYLITPDQQSETQLLAGLERARQAGIRLVQLRQTGLSADAYQALAERLITHFSGDFRWMLKGTAAPGIHQAGWHLTGNQLRQLWKQQAAGQPAERSTTQWLAASCHNAEELQMAADLGVDFATLSPVLPTASHPEAAPLGWQHASQLIETVNMPVYLLGGLSPDQLPQAFAAGAQGIAAIRSLWSGERQI